MVIAFQSEGQYGSITKIKPDDYPVTDSMFEGNYEKVVSGEITSLDKAWFTNDTLNQTLVFELYTDFHRLEIYHFYNTNIPSEIIGKIELHVATGPFNNIFDTATSKQKHMFFKGFIQSAQRIKQSYFTTLKGLTLGDKKEKALRIYGKPDKYSVSKGIEKYRWHFEGVYSALESTTKIKTSKPLASGSWGFGVQMYFRAGRLVAMILSNELP